MTRSVMNRLGLALVVGLMLFAASPASAVVPAGNLLLNPGAEDDTDATVGGSDVDVDLWDPETGAFTAIKYDDASGFPTTAESTRIGGASNFFGGGPAALSTGEQTYDASGAATEIDAGSVQAAISGWLGGFAEQTDNMKVDVFFEGTGGTDLGAPGADLTIGPVTPTDRGGLTEFRFRASGGSVPTGTRSLRVVQTANRDAGTSNDGYSDNLVLTLSEGGDCASSNAITDGGPGDADGADNGVIVGSPGNDFLKGDGSSETLNGLGGDDLLCGDGGNDILNGGEGDDDNFGEAGNDGFNPGVDDPGADDYDGGTGGDRVFYDSDSDSVENRVTPGLGADDGDPAANAGAGEGDDVKGSTEHVDFGPANNFFADPVVGADNTVRGGAGDDLMAGGDGKDLLLGQDGADSSLNGQAGNDKVNGGADADSVAGGDGSDHLYGGPGTLAGGDSICGGVCSPNAPDGNDLIYGGDNVAAETLDGDAGNDRIYGEDGPDTLTGNEGHDVLVGGGGGDDLLGEDGNDTLVPGPDDWPDTLGGGPDTDRAGYDNETVSVYAAIGAGAVSGTDPDGPGGPDTGSLEGDEIFADVENVFTGAGDDTLIGDGDANYLLGNAGADTIFGRDGLDTLIGKLGDDFLIGSDDGATAVKDLLHCNGDTGVAPRDRFSADVSDVNVSNQCETAAPPPP